LRRVRERGANLPYGRIKKRGGPWCATSLVKYYTPLDRRIESLPGRGSRESESVVRGEKKEHSFRA